MRVVGGSSRGRVIRAPAGTGTRPTSDRVREAIFDVLSNLVELDGASVADLFAGSGAMGIEALSRGAEAAVFVDTDRAALEAVRSNLRSAGLEAAAASIVRADVLTWLSRKAPTGESRTRAPGRPGPFDLALCDPPYAFSRWRLLLEKLDATVAVLESDRPLEVPTRWDVVRQKGYGGTLVTVVSAAREQRSGGSHDDDAVRGRFADLFTSSDTDQEGVS
ncbi:MAG TPA: RsmD family RNA methyltransferase [Acidimicrobiales bacterium]|nr:RsmD family RNA methyltransferase [Acidimicrobiales bacterium]